jgi:uncharacterized membrane protein
VTVRDGRTSGKDAVVSTITREVEINASPDEVWRLLEDVRRLPEFSTSTVEVVDAPELITAAGQGYTQVGRLLGKTYSSHWTVVDLEPGRRIRSEGSVGPGVRYCLSQQLEEVAPGRSRLAIVVDYGLPRGLLGRLVAKAGIEQRAAREAEAVLDGIRTTVEQNR